MISGARKGLLARHFRGVAAKRLSAVEADPDASNQHEFNGVGELKRLFGSEKAEFPARFVWIGDEQEAISDDGSLTWYDARERHPSRSEYRLYYPANAVMSGAAKEGDTVFICATTDDKVLVVVTPPESEIEKHLAWLFGLPDQLKLTFDAREILGADDGKLDFAIRLVLDELGVDSADDTDTFDESLARFGAQFPPTREFSAFARATLKHVTAKDDADAALFAWMEREDLLFRRLERHIVGERLKQGFMVAAGSDVDGFMKFSLSVQNRRKARAGAALENHLEFLFAERGIRHGRGCITENNNRPDFLFPGCAQYADAEFPAASLTMLGAKSTLKDRWRQVLSEAARIETKHLLTLSPGVSANQTDEMRAKNLRLVVPTKLHETYRPAQRPWLMSLGQFIELVLDRQPR